MNDGALESKSKESKDDEPDVIINTPEHEKVVLNHVLMDTPKKISSKKNVFYD